MCSDSSTCDWKTRISTMVGVDGWIARNSVWALSSVSRKPNGRCDVDRCRRHGSVGVLSCGRSFRLGRVRGPQGKSLSGSRLRVDGCRLGTDCKILKFGASAGEGTRTSSGNGFRVSQNALERFRSDPATGELQL